MDKEYTIIKVMTSHLEAQMLCNMLQANGVDAHSRGAKEYASHLTGVDHGRYEIVVPEAEIEKANGLMESVQSENVERTPIPASRYLQSALLFSVIGLFLIPFVFNAVSLFSLGGYWKREEPSNKKIAWSVLTVVINIVGVGFYLKLWSF